MLAACERLRPWNVFVFPVRQAFSSLWRFADFVRIQTLAFMASQARRFQNPTGMRLRARLYSTVFSDSAMLIFSSLKRSAKLTRMANANVSTTARP